MMSGIELAALVFRDHAAEFWTTVSQSGPTGRPSVTCGATEGDLSLTRMHLNPYGESDCAGVDLIGEWTSSFGLFGATHKRRVKSQDSWLIRHSFLLYCFSARCANSNCSCHIMASTVYHL